MVFWEYKELRERDFKVSDLVRLKILSLSPEKYPNWKGRKSEWEVEELWEWEDKGGLGTTLFLLIFFFKDFSYFLLISNLLKKK